MNENKNEYISNQILSGLKIDDFVIVKSIAETDEKGWGTCWTSDMDQYVNKIGKIVEINGDLGIVISFCDGKTKYYFPYFILEKLKVSISNINNKPQEIIMDDINNIKITCNNLESAKNLINILIKRDYNFLYEVVNLLETEYIISINNLRIEDVKLLIEGKY